MRRAGSRCAPATRRTSNARGRSTRGGPFSSVFWPAARSGRRCWSMDEPQKGAASGGVAVQINQVYDQVMYDELYREYWGRSDFVNFICVEAAFHFDTRDRFLREACRVLKPGGRLVLSDSLFTRWWERIKPPGRMLNYVEDAAAYRGLCQAAGFADAEVIDAREECASRFLRNCVRFLRARRLAGAIDRDALKKMSARMSLYVLNIRHYLLVAARKAAAPDTAVTESSTTPSL